MISLQRCFACIFAFATVAFQWTCAGKRDSTGILFWISYNFKRRMLSYSL